MKWSEKETFPYCIKTKKTLHIHWNYVKVVSFLKNSQLLKIQKLMMNNNTNTELSVVSMKPRHTKNHSSAHQGTMRIL